MGSHTITASDGVHLHLFYTPSTKKLPIILYIHGQGSYGQSGRHLGAYFQEKGYGYAALDLRGHGASEGSACFVREFSDYQKDILAALEFLKGPIILVGHSMGALAVWNTLPLTKNIVGTVLSSPAMGLRFVPSKISVGLAHIFKYIPVLQKAHFATGINPQKATHDIKEQQWLMEDENIKDFITPSLFFSFIDAMTHARKEQYKVSMPLLVLWGTEDQTIDPQCMEEFTLGLEKNGNKVTKKVYAGLYHSLLLESTRSKIFKDIFSWIKKLRNS